MENNNENKGFQYTYSAREQAELKRIREKYTPRPKPRIRWNASANLMQALRKRHRQLL